jgi:hypothetical protein
MIAGIMPLVLGIAWVVAVIAHAQSHKGQAGGSDAFLMIAVLIVTYAWALLVGGAGAVWSALVARRHPACASRAAKLIRMLVLAALLAPLALYFALNFALAWMSR